MVQRTRRKRSIPRLEAFEDRTMLSGLGVNVEFNYHGQGEAVWTDVSRMFGKWNYVSKTNWQTPNPAVVTNSLASPLTDASTYLTLANYPDGVYQVSFKGTAKVDFWGVGSLAAPLVKGADGVSRGQLVVNNANDVSKGQRYLIMDVTSINTSDPLADLKIIAPGYPADGSQQYMAGFLQQLQPFDEIRFLNWELTNSSMLVHWSDRSQPDQILSTTTAGRAIDYERMIELGNEAHKDIWLNVPALADDDFVKNLADLVRDKLSPDLKVYIEYSNETWNSGSAQRNQVLNASNANPLITTTDSTLRVAQQTAFKLKGISDIFRQEFGAGFDRVIPVLAGWTIYPTVIQSGLQFIQQHYGDPAQFVKSTAIAPYISLRSAVNTPNLSATGLFDAMNQYIDYLAPYIQQNVQVAAAYGLPLDAYEGGQNLSGNINFPTKYAIQNDPRMYTIYKRYLDVWKGLGGGQMALFTLYGDFWGLKTHVTDAGSQKFDAVISTLVPAGDATLDGKVDFADFQTLTANYGQSDKWWTQGDFNHDNKVDYADMSLLLSNIGAGALSADQAAQVAVFASNSKLPANQALEFNLFGSSYASDLGFTSAGGGPVVVDKAFNGFLAGAGLPTLNGTAYSKGLGVPSNSKINVPIKGAYTSFDAIIGVDDQAVAGAGGSVFQVLGDGKVLYTSPVMKVGAPSIPIEVSVKGVATLSLVVTATGGASPSTPADWAMARLVDSKSTASAPATKLAWTVTKNGALFTSSTADSFVFSPAGPGSYVVTAQATAPNGVKASRSLPVDVYSASTANSATYVGLDVTRKGTWKGAYGAAGYALANDAAGYPAYASVSVSGQLNCTWLPSTTDVRGLQKAGSATDRLAATWYSANKFAIDVAFFDGLSHQVSLYAVDWDNLGRSERIDVVDAATGAVLESRTLSSFRNGAYLTFNVSGHVQFRVTRLAGKNAVVSGVFIDSKSSASFFNSDQSTQGTWNGTYGSQAYSVANGGASLPSYAAVSVSGQLNCTWVASTTDVRGLQKAAGATARLAATWYSADQFTIDVNLKDGLSHQVSLYAVDWDNLGRSERIDVVDAATGAVLESRTLSSFRNGAYLTFNVSGHVQFRVTRLAGKNAVVSGVFIDSEPGTVFLGQEAATQGTWIGNYGTEGYNVAGSGSKAPAYAATSITGALNWVWTPNTSDLRAQQKSTNSASRIAAAWYNTTPFTIDVNVNDGLSHKVSLYLLDWDKQNRVQRIDVLDAVTGKVLDSRTIKSFQNGIYLSWNISGHVKFQITGLVGPNAVLSGLFFR